LSLRFLVTLLPASTVLTGCEDSCWSLFANVATDLAVGQGMVDAPAPSTLA
jgi:hypothetical protein